MKGIVELKLNVLKRGIHYITSDYKTRNEKRPTHSGIDFVSYNGKNTCTDYIISVYDGIVSKVGYSKNGSGYYVQIKHTNNIYSIYCHMKAKSMTVKEGDTVKKGTVIGYMGSTGNSTGAHLHFGISINKKYVDPYPYLMNEEMFKDKWTLGDYELIYSKTIRTSTSLTLSNRVKVGQCLPEVRKQLTSTNKNDIAKFKIGSIVNITEIIYENKRVWGKMKNCYIVLCNKDGTKQARKIN